MVGVWAFPLAGFLLQPPSVSRAQPRERSWSSGSTGASVALSGEKVGHAETTTGSGRQPWTAPRSWHIFSPATQTWEKRWKEPRDQMYAIRIGTLIVLVLW